MERMTLLILKDDEYNDWFDFYRVSHKTKSLAWDNSCFEKDNDIDLSCFINDYNFGRRMLKRYN